MHEKEGKYKEEKITEKKDKFRKIKFKETYENAAKYAWNHISLRGFHHIQRSS